MPERKGLMYDPYSPNSKYPISRDMAEVNCSNKQCYLNRVGCCSAPSVIEIGADGRCKHWAKSKDKKND